MVSYINKRRYKIKSLLFIVLLATASMTNAAGISIHVRIFFCNGHKDEI